MKRKSKCKDVRVLCGRFIFYLLPLIVIVIFGVCIGLSMQTAEDWCQERGYNTFEFEEKVGGQVYYLCCNYKLNQDYSGFD